MFHATGADGFGITSLRAAYQGWVVLKAPEPLPEVGKGVAPGARQIAMDDGGQRKHQKDGGTLGERPERVDHEDVHPVLAIVPVVKNALLPDR